MLRYQIKELAGCSSRKREGGPPCFHRVESPFFAAVYRPGRRVVLPGEIKGREGNGEWGRIEGQVRESEGCVWRSYGGMKKVTM